MSPHVAAKTAMESTVSMSELSDCRAGYAVGEKRMFAHSLPVSRGIETISPPQSPDCHASDSK
jgi:hypothetical protein